LAALGKVELFLRNYFKDLRPFLLKWFLFYKDI